MTAQLQISSALMRKGKLPSWFRQDIPTQAALSMMGTLRQAGIHTVCQEAHCPNLTQCFDRCHVTFMILGSACTRRCRFCAVDKMTLRKQGLVDFQEPQRIKTAVKKLGLRYVVVTSVTRDDLPDGGAASFKQTIKMIKELDRSIEVEALIPDFQGNPQSIACVLEAGADVIAHNIETVKRLYPSVRPQANYEVSLKVLSFLKQKQPRLLTKSSLMLGMGEDERELERALEDLRGCGCDIVTLGQYLAPSSNHFPVSEFVQPHAFETIQKKALAMGFKAVVAHPLARSSYLAQEAKEEALCMM
ncbi:MAG: lipoyl synthase [Candidatus Omnitrophica bacterium]|nr:lipoyl synthase [Candidatus Omnitrophota bacterium]